MKFFNTFRHFRVYYGLVLVPADCKNMRGVRGGLPVLSKPDLKNSFHKEKYSVPLCLGGS